MLQTTAQVPFLAKFCAPPPEKTSNRPNIEVRNALRRKHLILNSVNDEGKNLPKHSHLLTGLCGTTWILGMNICWQWVEN